MATWPKVWRKRSTNKKIWKDAIYSYVGGVCFLAEDHFNLDVLFFSTVVITSEPKSFGDDEPNL